MPFNCSCRARTIKRHHHQAENSVPLRNLY
jgi:hypothetical protein